MQADGLEARKQGLRDRLDAARGLRMEVAEEQARDLVAEQLRAIEMLKVKAAAATTIMKAIEMLQPFSGDVGELNHFLKGGDRVHATIEHKLEVALLDPYDAAALRAALIGRIRFHVLNQIQAEEDTPWTVAKDRLKKAFGGGRWSPEEDLFRLYRLRRGRRQSEGEYARALLTRYHQVVAKMRETTDGHVVETQSGLIAAVLKVQLADEVGRREGFPKEKEFPTCAQELMEASARCEEALGYPEEPRWTDMEQRAPGRWGRPDERNNRPLRGRRQRTGYDDRREATRPGRPSPRREDGQRPRGRREGPEKRCFECGQRGHLAARCPKIACFECNSQGHVARNCPYMAKRNADRGEPMDINAQRVRRGPASSEPSGTEADEYSSGEESDRPHDHQERISRRKTYSEAARETAGRTRVLA